MKSLSSAIVVLSGAIILAGGAQVQHGDTQFVVSAIGCLVVLVGLIGWGKFLGKSE